MQGTMHVRSLIRLFIGAVLLCLAWLVLTSGSASAAERPGPARPLAGLGRTFPLVDDHGLEPLLDGVLGRPAHPSERPSDRAARRAKSHAAAKAASAQKLSGTGTSTTRKVASKSSTNAPSAARIATSGAVLKGAVDEVSRRVDPVVEDVELTVRSTTDATLTVVTDVTAVAAAVPVAGDPVVQVTDAVVALVQGLPVLGIPSPIVPLPIGGGVPSDAVPIPGITEAVAAERDPSTPSGEISTTVVRGRPAWLTQDGAAPPSRDGAWARAGAPAAPRGHGVPRGPWSPLGPSPLLPNQPSPAGGTAPSAGDPAVAGAAVVLPSSRMFGRSSADWRVPRGLPAHPGTRPD
jgi:hypothetical protein